MGRKKTSLTEGDILKGLIGMALPIMGTSFLQMAYGIGDMFWIGKLGSEALAAVAIGSFFMWLSNAFIMLSKTGTEVRVAQCTGAGEDSKAEIYARSGLHLVAILALVYMSFLLLFKNALVGFFDLESLLVIDMAKKYLVIIAVGMFFPFANQVFTGIFTGRGDSGTPFKINLVGLSLNMILDPLFILILNWGVAGAALATVIAQGVAFFIFLYKIKVQKSLFQYFTFFKKPNLTFIKDIAHLGALPGLQSGFFTLISMVIARIVSEYGDIPVGIQKVGSQIEALTWMTALGISVALGAFVGQNYGAKQYQRVMRGYQTALKLAVVLGTFTTLLFYIGSEVIFGAFVHDQESLAMGAQYLKILSVSQLFMCVEITISGAFNGMGATKPPAIIGIIFNLLRIPLALFLSRYTILGLNGVWWSISISSILKGIVAYAWIEYVLRTEGMFTQTSQAISK